MTVSSDGFKQQTKAVKADFSADGTLAMPDITVLGLVLNNVHRGGAKMRVCSGRVRSYRAVLQGAQRGRSAGDDCKATRETGEKRAQERRKRDCWS